MSKVRKKEKKARPIGRSPCPRPPIDAKRRSKAAKKAVATRKKKQAIDEANDDHECSWERCQSTFDIPVPMKEVVLETVCDSCKTCWLDKINEEIKRLKTLGVMDEDGLDDAFECPWDGVAVRSKMEPDTKQWDRWMEYMVLKQEYAKAWHWMDWDWKEAWNNEEGTKE